MTDGSFVENSHYYLTYILPWILLVLAVFGLSALVYHCRKGGECNTIASSPKRTEQGTYDKFDVKPSSTKA